MYFGTLSKIEGITRENEKQITYYRKSNLSDETWDRFNMDFLQSIKMHIPSPYILDANSLANSINCVYKDTIDKYMPLKKLSRNPKFKDDRPWLTSGLKTSIAKMYELLRVSKQSGLPEDNHKYTTYLNKLTLLKIKPKIITGRGKLSCMAKTRQKSDSL